ncbi:MAG: caspase family protein [Pseudomonadota bacterium]
MLRFRGNMSCLWISFAVLALLIHGCKTMDGAGASESTSRAITVAPKAEVAPPPEPKTRFVVQIMKADTPLRFSPDGRLLVSTDAGRGTLLQLWDVGTGRLLRTFPPDRSKIARVRFDPKGRYLLVVNDQADIRLVDLSTGGTVAAVDPQKSGAKVKMAEFTPDGRRLLIRRECCAARLFDVDTGAEVRKFTIEGMAAPAECLLSPDGTRVLFGVGQQALKNFRFEWYDLATGQKTGSFSVPDMVPEFSNFEPVLSPDGRYLVRRVSRFRPKYTPLIEIIDLERRQVRHLPEPSGYLPMQISADSRYLFTAIGIGTHIQMWALDTGRHVRDLGPRTPFGFAVSPSAPIIAYGVSMAGAADLSVSKIDLFDFEKDASRKQIAGLSHHGIDNQKLQFLADGNAFIDGKFIDLKRGILTPSSSHNYPAAVSGDGTRVLWRGSLKPIRTKEDYAAYGNKQLILCPWPECTKPEVLPDSLFGDYFPKMLNRDGSRMLLWKPGSGQGTHAVIAMETGAAPVPLREYPTGEPGYWRSDLSPILSADGTTVANGFVDGHNDTGLVYLWDAATGKKQKIFRSSGSVLMQALSFSPDSRLLAAAITTVEMKYEGGMGHWLLGYDFARSFNRTRVELWHVSSGRRLRTFENIGAWVQTLTFDPDGRELFVGGQDGLVHRFDVASGGLLRTYATFSPVSAISISPDGQRMLVSGFGETYWDLTTGSQLYTIFFPLGPTILGQPQEYLTWTPDGYYQGSDRLARNFVHLVTDFKTYAIDQFFEQFYNPVMIQARATGLPTDAFNIAAVLDGSPPPRVEMLPPNVGSKGTAEITVVAKDTGGGVREVRFYQNGKRIGDGAWTAVKSVQLSEGRQGVRDRGFTRALEASSDTTNTASAPGPPVDRGDVRKTYKVRLLSGDNTFRAVAFSGEMIESAPVEITVAHKGKDDRGVLYIIAIGILDYRPPLSRLPAARADAESFVQQLTDTAPALFGSFNAVTLYDVKATRKKILEAMASVEKKASAADTLVFFFAGHGTVLDTDGRFYLVAQGVNALEADAPGAVNREGISDLELGSALQRIPALRQVVFIDACQSGGADLAEAFKRSGEEVAVKRVGRAAGTWVFSAAGKTEYAWETPKLGHGLFTQALLTGMTGAADQQKNDGGIRLSELEAFVSLKVAEYARQLDIQQQPVIQKGLNDFPIAK